MWKASAEKQDYWKKSSLENGTNFSRKKKKYITK